MRNVRERMQVLFGEAAHVEIESRPGRGTKVVLTMPVLERAGTEWGKLRATPSAAIPTAARPWN
jgi:two-component system LytT family sensor kinase